MSEIIEGEYALAVQEQPAAIAIAPTVSPDEAREAMRQYQAVCEAVLTPDDYQTFKERGKEKRFKKKSAVKKLQTFWSVDVRVREMVRDDLGDGHFGFRCIATASMPNGRTVESTGGCSTFEERFDLKPFDDESPQRLAERAKKARARSYHDVMSTAETRATNRAVMNCIGVGGGEVTADEISRPLYQTPARAQQSPQEPAHSVDDYKAAWLAKGAPEGSGKAFMAKHGGTIASAMAALAKYPDAAAVAEAFALDPEPAKPTLQAVPDNEDPLAKERRRMRAIVKERGISDAVRKSIILRMFSKTSSSDLTFAQLVVLNGELQEYMP